MRSSHGCLALVVLLWASVLARGQAAGGVPAAGPQFRVVRSVSGSRGSVQQGRYIIDDPRTIFYVPGDKQVIVYFEWEGPVGKHHFEGYWKNPEGKIVVISDFSYEANQHRFGGYWTLDLTDSVAPGMWSVEARVDGEVTGSYTFQIVAAAKPADVAPTRHVLPPSEIYQRAMAATVTLDRFDDKGSKTGTGTGFFVGDDLVVTAFQNIDGATKVTAVLPNAHRIDTDQVLAWNRWQDWALLRVVTSTSPPKLERAAEGSWSVGDRCFSLQNPAEGDRVLVDMNLTGIHKFPDAGDRLNLSSVAASGAPVLNEYGELIGVGGGSLYPGLTSTSVYWVDLTVRQPPMATPITSIPAAPPAAAKTLYDLATAGQFTPPVTKDDDMLYSVVSDHVDQYKGMNFPAGAASKSELSRRQGHMAVLVVYNPRSKRSLDVAVRVYDLNNNTVGAVPPKHVKFNPGQFLSVTWGFDLTKLRVGTYRVDALENDHPVWREYVRVID